MIEILYFDWNGTRDELVTYCKKYKEACVKHGLNYKGCYAPPNDRYNWTIFVENAKTPASTADYNSFNPAWSEAGGKPPQMGHVIMKYYVSMGF
ncbi:hypothetical protein E4H04_10910 [Candidatus Bathyarchaeota archaeon]|nr:MAG: hypothetical protein E4H04_10910 [Candidatus Bathyarchaeota archaeon]